jgi:hypothetical protein
LGCCPRSTISLRAPRTRRRTSPCCLSRSSVIRSRFVSSGCCCFLLWLGNTSSLRPMQVQIAKPRAGKRLIFGAATEKRRRPGFSWYSRSLGRILNTILDIMGWSCPPCLHSELFPSDILSANGVGLFPCKFRRRSQHSFICASFPPSLDSLESHCERFSLRYVA